MSLLETSVNIFSSHFLGTLNGILHCRGFIVEEDLTLNLTVHCASNKNISSVFIVGKLRKMAMKHQLGK